MLSTLDGFEKGKAHDERAYAAPGNYDTSTDHYVCAGRLSAGLPGSPAHGDTLTDYHHDRVAHQLADGQLNAITIADAFTIPNGCTGFLSQAAEALCVCCQTHRDTHAYPKSYACAGNVDQRICDNAY